VELTILPARPSVRSLIELIDTPPAPSSHSVFALTSAINSPVNTWAEKKGPGSGEGRRDWVLGREEGTRQTELGKGSEGVYMFTCARPPGAQTTAGGENLRFDI